MISGTSAASASRMVNRSVSITPMPARAVLSRAGDRSSAKHPRPRVHHGRLARRRTEEVIAELQRARLVHGRERMGVVAQAGLAIERLGGGRDGGIDNPEGPPPGGPDPRAGPPQGWWRPRPPGPRTPA